MLIASLNLSSFVHYFIKFVNFAESFLQTNIHFKSEKIEFEKYFLKTVKPSNRQTCAMINIYNLN